MKPKERLQIELNLKCRIMIFDQVDLFLNSISSYVCLFRGNCFIAGLSKNEIEQAFSQNSKYQDYDFDFLFDHARNFVNELNRNSENHNFNEIERFYNSQLDMFYSDLIDVFGYTKSIESDFNNETGFFSSEFEDKMNTIAFGLKNIAEIILDGLKQYFAPPLPNEIMEYFYPFDEYGNGLQSQQFEALPQPKLSIKHIALKLAYENVSVTKKNANEIIKEYGHSSGEKLYQQYNQFRTIGNRIDTETLGTKKKIENRIKLIKEVSEFLASNLKDKAKQEVITLELQLLKF